MVSVYRTNIQPTSYSEFDCKGDFSDAAAEAGQMLLDLLPLAVLLVRRDARLIYANPVGRNLLANELQLDTQRHCSARRASTALLLRSKISEAVKSGRRCEFALPREDAPALAACIFPMPPSTCALSEMALLVLSDTGRPCLAAAGILRDMFGLTAAEARIALALSNGGSLEEIAEANGLALNTIRCYVKQLFAKMGVRRQSELIRLVLNGPGALPAPTSQVRATRGLLPGDNVSKLDTRHSAHIGAAHGS